MYIFHLFLGAPLSYFKWYFLENAYCIYIKIQLILSNRTYIGLAEILLWIFSKDAMEKTKQIFWPTHTLQFFHLIFFFFYCTFNTVHAKNGHCERILPVP